MPLSYKLSFDREGIVLPTISHELAHNTSLRTRERAVVLVDTYSQYGIIIDTLLPPTCRPKKPTCTRALDIPPTPECFPLTSSRISMVSMTERVSSRSLRLPEPRLPLVRTMMPKHLRSYFYPSGSPAGLSLLSCPCSWKFRYY